MTRENAIRELKQFSGTTRLRLSANFWVALNMAIKALEQESCEDAVSRASVFEIMGNLMGIPYECDRQITEKDASESMDEIRNLPSVTPKGVTVTDFADKCRECGKLKKGKWIPVSERLPEKAGGYLVTYHPCYWGQVREDRYVGLDSFRGKTMWAKNKYQKVIAWQPLPEPYREEKEVKE